MAEVHIIEILHVVKGQQPKAVFGDSAYHQVAVSPVCIAV